jgi:hypothetical protein
MGNLLGIYFNYLAFITRDHTCSRISCIDRTVLVFFFFRRLIQRSTQPLLCLNPFHSKSHQLYFAPSWQLGTNHSTFYMLVSAFVRLKSFLCDPASS